MFGRRGQLREICQDFSSGEPWAIHSRDEGHWSSHHWQSMAHKGETSSKRENLAKERANGIQIQLCIGLSQLQFQHIQSINNKYLKSNDPTSINTCSLFSLWNETWFLSLTSNLRRIWQFFLNSRVKRQISIKFTKIVSRTYKMKPSQPWGT